MVEAAIGNPAALTSVVEHDAPTRLDPTDAPCQSGSPLRTAGGEQRVVLAAEEAKLERIESEGGSGSSQGGWDGLFEQSPVQDHADAARIRELSCVRRQPVGNVDRSMGPPNQ